MRGRNTLKVTYDPKATEGDALWQWMVTDLVGQAGMELSRVLGKSSLHSTLGKKPPWTRHIRICLCRAVTCLVSAGSPGSSRHAMQRVALQRPVGRTGICPSHQEQNPDAAWQWVKIPLLRMRPGRRKWTAGPKLSFPRVHRSLYRPTGNGGSHRHSKALEIAKSPAWMNAAGIDMYAINRIWDIVLKTKCQERSP